MSDINTYKPKTFYKRDQLNSEINAFQKAGNTHAKHGQRLILSIINDLEETGNMEYVWKFLDKMPVNVSASAFKKWFLAFGKIREPKNAEERESTKCQHGLMYDKKGKTDLSGGADKPWWNFKPNEVRGFDLFKAVQTAVKNAHKAEERELEEGQVLKGEDNIPEPLLQDLERLVKKYDTNKSNVA